MMTTKKKIDDILRGYIECALWSSTDNSDEGGGEPLDKNYDRRDIADSAIRSMRADIVKFVRANKKAIEDYYEHLEYRREHGNMNEHLGHDLWLTRNGHGAGFFDRDFDDGRDDIGKKLQTASKRLGESNIYIGDDNLLYVY